MKPKQTKLTATMPPLRTRQRKRFYWFENQKPGLAAGFLLLVIQGGQDRSIPQAY